MIAACSFWALFLLGSLPQSHAQEPVDTALVVAIDSSNSIEDATLDLEFRATLAALESDSTLQAIHSGYHGCIALSVVMWSTRWRQEVVADWTRVCSKEDMLRFTEPMTRPFYGLLHQHGSTTSLAGALEFSMRKQEDCPFRAERRVIDVSGNGVESNLTTGLQQLKLLRDAADTRGIIVNGLAIVTPRSEKDLPVFYRRWVITPTGFLIVATGPEHFQEAMERKFWQEIAMVRPRFRVGTRRLDNPVGVSHRS